MRIVCGMTAGAADSKISNQPVIFESNRIGSVRFEFESNLEYSQVPPYVLVNLCAYSLYLSVYLSVSFFYLFYLRGE